MKKHFSVDKHTPVTFGTFECLEICIKNGSDCKRLCVVYKPPSCSKKTFLEEFEGYLGNHVTTSGSLLIMGDFNFHMEDDSDSDTLSFRNLLFGHNLDQHVCLPTHIRGHMLDLVITRNMELPISDIDVRGPTFSDHCPLMFTCPWSKQLIPKQTIKVRDIKDLDIDAFESDLKKSHLLSDPPDNLDELLTLYNGTLTELMDKYAPAKVKHIRPRNSRPWFNAEIQNAKQVRRRAERKWRKSQLSIDLHLLQEAHKNVSTLCSSAKQSYYCTKIKNCEGDQNKLFKIGNSLLHRKSCSSLPSFKTESDLAEHFCDFFLNKIQMIKNSFPNNCQDNNSTVSASHGVDTLTCLKLLTSEDLSKLVMSGNSKSCSLDPAPTKVVKLILPTILPVLLKIVNGSLATSYVPKQLKIATVTPLLKKPSLDKQDLKNYRPVSNLAYVGKLIESVVVSQIDSHMSEHNMHQPLQSAYKQFHSVESALLKVTSDILMDIDDHKCVLLILLDLSAAFDTFEHEIFLRRLEQDIGVKGDPIKWFQ